MSSVRVAKQFNTIMTTYRTEHPDSILATLSAQVAQCLTTDMPAGCRTMRRRPGKSWLAMKTMSNELGRQGVICASQHPGTVTMDLRAPFRKNFVKDKVFGVDDAVGVLLDVFGCVREADSGRFFAYDRSEIPSKLHELVRF